jgi:hypothetical protein
LDGAVVGDPTGESNGEALRLDFDRRLMLGFRGSVITSDAGLLAYRELDDVLALTTTGGERLADAWQAWQSNKAHALPAALRRGQPCPSRLLQDAFDAAERGADL